MGWLAFGLALTGLGLIGVVFGHLALRASARGAATNRGVALAGTILGYASVAVMAGAVVVVFAPGLLSFGSGPSTPSVTVTPTTASGGFTLDTSPTVADHWYDLAIGDCVLAFDEQADPSDLMIAEPEVVSCGQPHYGEVYAIADIEGDDVPDDADFRRHSRKVCAGDLFAAYVGVPYSASEIYYDVLYPAERSWDSGTHQMVCLLVEGDDTTGSLQGASR